MDKQKAGYAEGIVSVVVNFLLFIFRFWVGMVTGSIALMADAWHTLSDSLSSIVIIVAVRLSSKKADREHPFGHGRWEQIAALFIAFLLAVIAFDFAKEAIIQFKNHESVEFGTLAIVATIIAIVVKEALAQYAFYIGRKTDNASIKADGWHHRTDALASVAVLIGILLSDRFWWMDSALGMIIALVLFYAAYKIAMEAITKLLGETPDEALTEKILSSIQEKYDMPLQPHHFHIHNYVAHSELTFHIKLNGAMSIMESHRIATEIENMIKEQFSITATIHIEPLDFEHILD